MALKIMMNMLDRDTPLYYLAIKKHEAENQTMA